MHVFLYLLVMVISVLASPFMASNEVQAAAGLDLNETVLDNGMKVIVVENDRAPVVVSQVWYKVGGSYEHDGITGVSHVLEHMMFKGTDNYPAGRFSEIIAMNGGKENAFTSKDYTAYFQRIENSKLELCLKLEADRMRNLLFDKAEFKKELEVVKEERRLRTDDKPVNLTYERFNAVAFTNSPYRQPIIGWMEDLNTLTVDDAKRWYDTWYVPNNVTLVVVGDVKASDVFELADKYFGSYKAVETPKTKRRKEADQYGVQRVTVKVPAKVPHLIMGYKVPVLNTTENESDIYALEVLAGVLDGGGSARLTSSLIRGQQIAVSAGAGYSMHALHDSLFSLSAVPADGVEIKQMEQALKQEIINLQKTAPSQKELDRVIAQVIASTVYEQDSSFYQAMEIGILETNGLGWRKKEEYVKGVQMVTPKQVQQVALKYFKDEYLTVAVLQPLSIDDANAKQKKTALLNLNQLKSNSGIMVSTASGFVHE